MGDNDQSQQSSMCAFSVWLCSCLSLFHIEGEQIIRGGNGMNEEMAATFTCDVWGTIFLRIRWITGPGICWNVSWSVQDLWYFTKLFWQIRSWHFVKKTKQTQVKLKNFCGYNLFTLYYALVSILLPIRACHHFYISTNPNQWFFIHPVVCLYQA